MKKSGPTIMSFVRKIKQQMGVEIVGLAAYRDGEGKLCTFEYVAPFFHDSLYFLKLTFHYSFCSNNGDKKDSFSEVHSGDVEELHGKWINWFTKRGNAG